MGGSRHLSSSIHTSRYPTLTLRLCDTLHSSGWTDGTETRSCAHDRWAWRAAFETGHVKRRRLKTTGRGSHPTSRSTHHRFYHLLEEGASANDSNCAAEQQHRKTSETARTASPRSTAEHTQTGTRDGLDRNGRNDDNLELAIDFRWSLMEFSLAPTACCVRCDVAQVGSEEWMEREWDWLECTRIFNTPLWLEHVGAGFSAAYWLVLPCLWRIERAYGLARQQMFHSLGSRLAAGVGSRCSSASTARWPFYVV